MSKTLKIPAPQAIRSVLAQLVSNVPELAPDANEADLGTTFGVVLKNDQDDPIGAVIADLTALVYFGGQFMMTPQDVLAEQVTAGEPNPATTEAFSEVVNIITTCFNAVDNNPHVRSVPARATTELLAASDTEWIGKPSQRSDLLGTFPWGTGRLIFVSR